MNGLEDAGDVKCGKTFEDVDPMSCLHQVIMDAVNIGLEIGGSIGGADGELKKRKRAGVRCNQNQTSISSITLSNSNISYSSSVKISGLPHLVNLSLDGNGFFGTTRISNMPSLRYPNISNNEFNDDLDWDYSTLPSLEVFDAYNNNFTSLYLLTSSN
ncbi:uncharacterized protein A4U43_C03F16500 [Asparagus officinalis]|uniref:Uncharacterized protein n=1 Tax=Asparagus officinalis TaxID=4686 RepID=A0A5P1FBI1_ASPOF|nr:uncharacterized protein A4U43_C03F16500 [Asparagus officinalis]